MSQFAGADPAVSDVIVISGFSLLSGTVSNVGLSVIVLKDWSERTEASLQPAAVVSRLNAQLGAIPQARIFAFNVPAIPGLGVVSGFRYASAGYQPICRRESWPPLPITWSPRPSSGRS